MATIRFGCPVGPNKPKFTEKDLLDRARKAEAAKLFFNFSKQLQTELFIVVKKKGEIVVDYPKRRWK